MFLSKNLATAAIDSLAKGDTALPISAFKYMLDQRSEDENAIAMIFDLTGFIQGIPDKPLMVFLKASMT
jgi:hypothetical protein